MINVRCHMSKALYRAITLALLSFGAPAQAEEQRFGLYELERASIGEGAPYYDTSLSTDNPDLAGRAAQSGEGSSAVETEASSSDHAGADSSDD